MSDFIPLRTKSTPATQLNCNAPPFKKRKGVEQPIAVKPLKEEETDIVKQKGQQTIVTPTATPIVHEITPTTNLIPFEKIASSKTWKRSKPVEHKVMKNEKTIGATKQIDKKVNLERDEKKGSGPIKFEQQTLKNAFFVRRKKENKEENKEENKTTSIPLIDEELQQNEKKIIKEKNNPQNEQPTMENQILITEGKPQKEEPKEEVKEEPKEELKEDTKEKAEEKKPESKKEKRNKKRSYKREHEEEQIEEQETFEIPPEEDEWKQVDKSGKVRP
ncbi:hypothetical protein ENU1_159480, partial [Entamoeba nuttalli P19]